MRVKLSHNHLALSRLSPLKPFLVLPLTISPNYLPSCTSKHKDTPPVCMVTNGGNVLASQQWWPVMSASPD